MYNGGIMNTIRLKTPFEVSDVPLSEYPRPQFARDSYKTLNGWWDYAVYKSKDGFPGWQGKILVPYSPECLLSGLPEGIEVKPEWTAGNPGLQRLLSGCMFPLGIILVVLAGAELFTGNNAVLIPGLMNRKYGIAPVLRNWALVYVGNFIGALFFVYVMIWCAGIVDADPWKSAIVQIAQTKTSLPWGVVFV